MYLESVEVSPIIGVLLGAEWLDDIAPFEDMHYFIIDLFIMRLVFTFVKTNI